MLLIPAIDIYQGKCVRLFQGDFEKETVFSTEPEIIAKQWMEAKVKRIHIVDLDGAKQGSLINSKTIQKIISSVNCTVQLGGGIRTISLAQQALDLGATKIIVGSAIIENINFLKPHLITMRITNLYKKYLKNFIGLIKYLQIKI